MLIDDDDTVFGLSNDVGLVQLRARGPKPKRQAAAKGK